MAGTPYVALLRGINVGGKNKIKMADLRAIFQDAGAREVATHIQSGNVLFRARRGEVQDILGRAREALADDHGIASPIVTRTAAAWTALAAAPHRLARRGDSPRLLMVAFLPRKPTKARVNRLDPERSPPDSFQVEGAEIFLRYPRGSARSKLDVAYLDRVLDTTATIRNWNTIQKIAARLAES